MSERVGNKVTLSEEYRTPSANTNRLIASCLGAHNGSVSAAALGSALEACARELVAARDAFYNQVKQQGLVESIPEAIQEVMDSFQAYAQALNFAKSWFDDAITHQLSEAATRIHDGYLDLNNSLLSYEWAYLSQGDEPHPALNLMSKIIAGVKNCQIDDDRLDDVLDRLWEHFSNGIVAYDKDPDPVRANHGKLALRQVLSGVQTIGEYLENYNTQVLDIGYARLRQGCLLLIENIQESTGEALANGPTPSPQVNWVIHSARAVLDGLRPQLLERATAWFEPQLSESNFRFEQAATKALQGHAKMAEQIPIARDGFDRLNRSLPLLRLGIERKNLLKKAIQHLEDGADLLHQAWQVFSEIEEEERQIRCVRCGSANEVNSRVCCSCGATLVRIAEDGALATQTPVTTETPAHLARILKACTDVETNAITQAQFAGEILWARQLLAGASQGLRRLPQTTSNPEVDQALNDLRQAMSDFSSGLDELQLYVDDRRRVHLTVGSATIVRACDTLSALQGMGAQAH